MKKLLFFSISIAFCFLLFSCEKTRDGLGLDTINNSARTGKWENVYYQVYTGDAGDPESSENLTEGSAYVRFQSDNKVHFYNSDGVENPSEAMTYSFLDTKKITLNGQEYEIQENLAGSFAKMTLQRKTASGREVYIFER